jgi:hypothetical protein
MPGKSRIAAVLAIVAATVLGAATDAWAGPPVPIPTVSQPLECVEQFENNPFYRADRWVEARALELNGIFMGCGDEWSGVVHIASEDSKGHTHPVDAASQQDFSTCFEVLVRFGKVSPDRLFPDTRDAYEYLFTEDTQFGPQPVLATLIVDREDRFVWNMFTSNTGATPRGNNWRGCAGPVA